MSNAQFSSSKCLLSKSNQTAHPVVRIFALLLAFSAISYPQVSNVRQTIENGRIIITYDLVGSSGNTYNMTITAMDPAGQIITPTAMAGDVKDVKPGKDLSLWWEPQLEGISANGWKVFLVVRNVGMIFVPGGTFQMGSTGGNSDEQPVHTVTLSSFYMKKTEVTQKEWREVVQWKQGSGTTPLNPNPSYFRGDNLPVEQVSWNDVQTWISYLNEKEGTTTYRLPTEAEWEFAARGGTHSQGYTYSGSNTVGDVAWYYSNSGNTTHSVGAKQANELGIYDISGNVWEWCSDWYGSYSSNAQTNPKGSGTGTYKVLRGGSWDDNCRVSDRYDDGGAPGVRGSGIGFRVVQD